MSRILRKSPKIWKLAKDLGIRPSDNPVADILSYCNKKIKIFLKDFPECRTLLSLLDCIAAKVGTVFREIHSDAELIQVKSDYLNKGVKIFAALEQELSEDVYGITIRLSNREPWEPEFVSIVDCRGDKAYRSYYTKWHEIAHLLVLTDQMRLSFTRTLHLDEKDPEEILVDKIAGAFGFYPPLIQPHINNEISFEEIENLRNHLCPEASQQSSLIGFVKAWPKPCLLLSCRPALKKREKDQLTQKCFDFREVPSPVMRAIKVTSNEAAQKNGILIFENMRVPERSVIHKVYAGGTDYREAEENLSWWETSDGLILPDIPIRVMAKKSWNYVHALIIPTNRMKKTGDIL